MDLLYKLTPFLIYCIVLIIITIRLRLKTPGDSEYFLAGRNLGPLVALISVIATETSVATIVIFPAVGMKSGLSLAWLCLGYILGRYIVATFYLGRIYKIQNISMYSELAGKNNVAHGLLSLFYILSKYISSGVRFFMGGYALNQLFPLLQNSDLSLALWILIIAVFVGIYSLSGGLKAVVYTDQLQGYIILVMGLFLLYHLSGNLNSSPELQLWNLDADWDNSLFAPFLFFGGLVLSIGTHGADQDMLQRILAVKDLKSAKRALFLSGLGATFIIILYLCVGFLLSSASQGLDKKSPLVSYIAALPSPLIIGSFAVLLIAAAMSTLDSAMHSTGAVLKSFFKSEASGRFWSLLSLLALTLSGLAFIILSQKSSNFLGLALGSMNYINGGLIGILTVFAFFPSRLTGAGVVFSLFAGSAITILCNFGLPIKPAWPLVTILSGSGAFIACLGGSFLSKR